MSKLGDWGIRSIVFGLAMLVYGLSGADDASNVVEVIVLAAGEVLPPSISPCKTEVDASCYAAIGDAFNLIHSPAWLSQLPDRVGIVRLRFSAGTHRLTSPVVVRWGAKGGNDVKLEIVGQGTRLSGAMPVAFAGLNADASVPAPIREFVLQAPLPASNFSPPPPRGFGLPIRPVSGELFFKNVAMPVAGWPNSGYGTVSRPATFSSEDKRTFEIEGRSSADWATESDLRIFAYWFHDWAAQSYAAHPVGKDNLLAIEGGGSHYGIKNGQRLRVENALVELDAPGEWYADRTRNLIYWWPVSALHEGDAEFSVAESLLVIEHSRNVVVRDLIFESVRGDALVVNNSHNVLFENVTIRNTGNRALVVNGGSDCGIRGGLIEDNGEGGVSLSGGDRIALAPARHFVTNSTIRRFSRLSKTYRFAVEVSGVGQQVVGNTISDAPHTAILFTGNDHRIAGNEIFNVVKETGDAGAIYVGRDFTARGTLIEDNFLHDIQPDGRGREVKGIYLDDQASGIVIRRNIFARVQQPVFIGGGRDNLVEDNLFYESSPAIHLDARGLNWQRAATLDPKRELQTRLDAVPYQQLPYASRYPNLSMIREDELGAPKYNVARRNVVIKSEPVRISNEAKSGIVVEKLRIEDESVFLFPAPVGGRNQLEDFRIRALDE